MTYIDGYVLVVKKKDLSAYKKMAKEAGQSWIKHGALNVIESVGEDLRIIPEMKKMGVNGFPELLKPKPSETILYSFILYKTRAHRDRVNKKVQKEMEEYAKCNPEEMKNIPFDMKKMWFGGFESLVDLK